MAFLAAIPAMLGTAMGASAATATMAGMTAITAGVSGAGALLSARAAAQQANSAAAAADYNAIVNQQNAEQARSAANVNEEAQRRKSAVEMGRVRAGLAESGIGLTSGTASDLTEQSAMNAELDALNTRYGGEMQARGYTAQATLDRATARQERSNARNAIVGGIFNAGASALSSYGTYSGYKAALKVS